MHPEERARYRAIGALSRRRGKAKVACSTSSLPPDSPIAKWCVTRAVSGCAGVPGATAVASPLNHFRCCGVKPL